MIGDDIDTICLTVTSFARLIPATMMALHRLDSVAGSLVISLANTIRFTLSSGIGCRASFLFSIRLFYVDAVFLAATIFARPIPAAIMALNRLDSVTDSLAIGFAHLF